MARPRKHSLDDLLDVAEQLVTTGDPAGITLRSLAAASGASNGTIYHAFRSKEELLARLWLRACDRLGDLMAEALDGTAGGDEAVVALALTPVTLAERYPATAQLFFAQRRDQLFSGDLAPEVVDALDAQYQRMTDLLVTVALDLWDRKDGVAVEAVGACVVDIPGGLLRRQLSWGRGVSPATGDRIVAAVRAVLALPLDPPPHH